MTGEPSWGQLDAEGAYLDGRTEQAKRFSFVVETLKPTGPPFTFPSPSPARQDDTPRRENDEA
jgi:hypothetical protein